VGEHAEVEVEVEVNVEVDGGGQRVGAEGLMISARRCSMVIRLCSISALAGSSSSLVMMTVGVSRPSPVTMSCRRVPG
jgi:hypothetical protein